MRRVRRALRPSRALLPCPAKAEGTTSIGSAARGGGSETVSGASRLVLASVAGGGAPSVLRRLSFERSAILVHHIDESLNKGIGLGVQPGITGLRDGMAGVLGLAIRRAFQKAAV